MLTLLITVLATAYFIVPELLTRFVVGLYFVRKASTGTRSEELLRSAFWAVVPLLLAWTTRHTGFWTVPYGFSDSAQTVFSDLYSEKLFELNPSGFYPALALFIRFNVCLLARTYLFVIVGSLCFGWLAINLGAIRSRFPKWHRTIRLLYWAFMPRISEWHIALSPILIRARHHLIVRIDVLTKSGTLYRGNVFEKRIAADGTLATLILHNAQRMVRADYKRDREQYEANKADMPGLQQPNTEDYWKVIPGELFLLVGSDIATVNVRHVRPLGVLKPREDEALLKAFAALSKELAAHFENDRP